MKNKILILGFLSFVLLSCNQTDQKAQGSIQDQKDEKYSGKIIDMHLHTGLPHQVPAGTPALCRPAPCQGDGQATVDPSDLRDKTVEVMDDNNITKAFLSGVDWSAVQEWRKSDPERFIASPFILKTGSSELEKLTEEYKSGSFEGMGEIGTQLMGLSPNDPSLEPYFQLAEEHNLPVLIHTLGIGPYMPHFRSGAGNPVLLEEVLVKHPDLRVFVENGGYPYREEMIAMMYQYPQLYVDMSTITWVIPRTAFYDYLEGFIRAGLGKRIMFGSDQMVWPEKIGAAVEAINQAPFLNAEQTEDIFYNNAVRFLKLQETM
ncbi:MAG: amidohydrolase family protein [Cyclobacteriaceae bacterium]|nr:amidohydrolase family protein [Cyclobacteriaceae bacterium]